MTNVILLRGLLTAMLFTACGIGSSGDEPALRPTTSQGDRQVTTEAIQHANETAIATVQQGVATPATSAGSSVATSSVTQVARQGDNTAQGRIVFASDRGGNSDIYVMDHDGSNLMNISNDPSGDYWPSWSPEGERVAFVSDRDGNQELYVMDSNGRDQTRLTTSPGTDTFPAWAPDGTKIAFVSSREGNLDIYVMNADGSDQLRVTSDAGLKYPPAWSPDGEKLAYVSDSNNEFEIYVLDITAMAVSNLTNNSADEHDPSWSPDGQYIVFTRATDADFDIFVMHADGSQQRRLTTAPGLDSFPAWSSDGQEIIFESDRDGNDEIYAMSDDGSNQRNLTRHAASDRAPKWTSPKAQSDVTAISTPEAYLGELITDLGGGHVSDTQTVAYNSDPPTSGAHWASTADWGIHDEPIPNELQVHNLEHGGIIIQYSCTNCPELLAQLVPLVTQCPVKLILGPRPGMASLIAVSAWTRLLTLDTFDRDLIQSFITSFVDKGPEVIPSETKILEESCPALDSDK